MRFKGAPFPGPAELEAWRAANADRMAELGKAMRPTLTPKQPDRVVITGTARPSQSSRAIVSYMHSLPSAQGSESLEWTEWDADGDSGVS